MQVTNAGSNLITRAYTRQVGGATPEVGRPPLRSADGRPRTDQVAISSGTQELMRLRSAVASAPDERSERVSALRAAIASGAYQVDANVLAAALMRGV